MNFSKKDMFECDICGKVCTYEQQLRMHKLTHNKEKTLSPETPHPKENVSASNFKFPKSAKEVEEKRAELEILRIDREIDRLKAPEVPDTKLDYFNKLIEMQQQFNEKMLLMQKQQFDVQLEMERIKAGASGNDDDGMLKEVFKYLPQIMAAKQKEVEHQKEPKKETEKMQKLTKAQMLEKLKQVKEGKLSHDDAYKEFCSQEPDLAKVVTREQFEVQLKKQVEKLK